MCTYRKVASSRPVYYSILDHFWFATNKDVLPLPCIEFNQVDHPATMIKDFKGGPKAAGTSLMMTAYKVA